ARHASSLSKSSHRQAARPAGVLGPRKLAGRMSTMSRAEGTYDRLADLDLVVEGYRLQPLSKPVASGFVRRTTVVRLMGGGAVGVGEELAYDEPDQERFQAAGPRL